jgi:hypothetical protein
VQPRVDAADVEQVPAPGQAPHHLAAAHLLQAHLARRAPGAAVVRGHRQHRSSARMSTSASPRAPPPGAAAEYSVPPAARAPARGHDAQAPGGAGGGRRGHGGEGARLPDDDGRGEHAGRTRRSATRRPRPRHRRRRSRRRVTCLAAVAGHRREPPRVQARHDQWSDGSVLAYLVVAAKVLARGNK